MGEREKHGQARVIERNGKFYWYVTVEHATIPGKSIGVAVPTLLSVHLKMHVVRHLLPMTLTTGIYLHPMGRHRPYCIH